MDTRSRLRVGVLGGAGLLMLGLAATPPVSAEPRPQVSALRLGEPAVLARFTAEVRTNRTLQERALALWRTHFSAQAAELERRFVSEDDWRPVLADAAELVDEFLEASLLPRHGEWRADGPEGAAGKVWVEELDRRTGQRVRTLRDARPRARLFAPGRDSKPEGDATDRQQKAAPPKPASRAK